VFDGSAEVSAAVGFDGLLHAQKQAAIIMKNSFFMVSDRNGGVFLLYKDTKKRDKNSFTNTVK